MPPPSNQKKDIEPPPELMEEATKGFLTGVVRFGSLSLLAHLIFVLPHPIHPATSSSSPSSSSTSTSTSTSTSSPSTRRPPTPLKARVLSTMYKPLISFSKSIGPVSRVYRGLTPQFKTFIQLSCMTLGGCIWAEKRVAEYLEVMRKIKRAERSGRA